MPNKYLITVVALICTLFLVACEGVIAIRSAKTTDPSPLEAGPADNVLPIQTKSTLETVRERGVLRCGGNASIPGFGYLDPETDQFSGFDIDFCRAVAAATLGDADAIQVYPVTALERFIILQTGEIDLLSRNTTRTLGRDALLNLNFAPTTFYDGQGILVPQGASIETLADLEGAIICVAAGTTTEENLADVFAKRGIEYKSLTAEDSAALLTMYEVGECDAYSADKSALVGQKILLTTPEAHLILAETISKEPLGPLVRQGDDQWLDIVTWVIYGLFTAEELGVTSQNVDTLAESSDDPAIRQLLHTAVEFGTILDLEPNFMIQVIKQVGNYGEIYDRHLGPETPMNLTRGLNAQYTAGGLIYAPPFR